MASEREAREFFVSIPLDKVGELEKFFQNALRERTLIRVAKRKMEILVVSRTGDETLPAMQYDVLIRGGDSEAVSFLTSLRATKLIPLGREWTVWGPVKVEVLF